MIWGGAKSRKTVSSKCGRIVDKIWIQRRKERKKWRNGRQKEGKDYKSGQKVDKMWKQSGQNTMKNGQKLDTWTQERTKL